jgi:hypothetical protein
MAKSYTLINYSKADIEAIAEDKVEKSNKFIYKTLSDLRIRIIELEKILSSVIDLGKFKMMSEANK